MSSPTNPHTAVSTTVAVLLLCTLCSVHATDRLLHFASGSDSGDCSASPCATLEYAVSQAADTGDRIVFQSSATAGEVPSLTVTNTDLTFVGDKTSYPYHNLDLGNNNITLTGGGDYVFDTLRVTATNNNGYGLRFETCTSATLANVATHAHGGLAYFHRVASSTISALTLTDYDYDNNPTLTPVMGVPLVWYEYGVHTVSALNATLSNGTAANHSSLFYLAPMTHDASYPTQSLALTSSGHVNGGSFRTGERVVKVEAHPDFPTAVGAQLSVTVDSFTLYGSRGGFLSTIIPDSMGVATADWTVSNSAFQYNEITHSRLFTYESAAVSGVYDSPTATLVFSLTTFVFNTSPADGAIVYVFDNNGTLQSDTWPGTASAPTLSLSFSGCLFDDNTAVGEGGVIAFYSTGPLTLTACDYHRNTVTATPTSAFTSFVGVFSASHTTLTWSGGYGWEFASDYIFSFSKWMSESESVWQALVDTPETRLRLSILNANVVCDGNDKGSMFVDTYVEVYLYGTTISYMGGYYTNHQYPALALDNTILPVWIESCRFEYNYNKRTITHGAMDDGPSRALYGGSLSLVNIRNITLLSNQATGSWGARGGGVSIYNNWPLWASENPHALSALGVRAGVEVYSLWAAGNIASDVGASVYIHVVDSAASGVSDISVDSLSCGTTTATNMAGCLYFNYEAADDEFAPTPITLSNFYSFKGDAARHGGAYVSVSGNTLTMSDWLVFQGTVTDEGGAGGIYVHADNASTITASGLDVYDCVSDFGPGGAVFSTTPGSTGAVYVDSSSFYNNDGWQGGGLSVFSGVHVSECDIHSNIASGSGGGVSVDVDSADLSESVYMSGCNIHNNIASGSGGGVSVNYDTSSDSSGSVYMTDCSVYANAAEGDGGGVAVAPSEFVVSGEFVFTSGSIDNNTAVGNGGAVYTRWNANATHSANLAVTFDSVGFSGNTASGNGGSVYAERVPPTLNTTGPVSTGNFTIHGGGSSSSSVSNSSANSAAAIVVVGEDWNIALTSHVVSNHTTDPFSMLNATSVSLPTNSRSIDVDGLVFVCEDVDYLFDCSGGGSLGNVSGLATACGSTYTAAANPLTCPPALQSVVSPCTNVSTLLGNLVVPSIVNLGVTFSVDFTSDIVGVPVMVSFLPGFTLAEEDWPDYAYAYSPSTPGAVGTAFAAIDFEGEYVAVASFFGADSCVAVVSEPFLVFRVDVVFTGLATSYYIGEVFNFTLHVDYTGDPVNGAARIGALEASDITETVLTPSSPGYPYFGNCGNKTITNGYLYSCPLAFRTAGLYQVAVVPYTVSGVALAQQLFTGVTRASEDITVSTPIIKFDSTVTLPLIESTAFAGTLRFRLENSGGDTLTAITQDDMSVIVEISPNTLPLTYTGSTVASGIVSVTDLVVAGVKTTSGPVVLTFYVSVNGEKVGSGVSNNFNLYCNDGFYNDGGVCSPCAPGSYGDYSVSGAPECQRCPLGKVTTASGAGECANCAAGMIPNTDQDGCVACPDGFTSTPGSPTCESCSAGTYSPNSAVPCTACPAGEYQDATGQTSCKSCPDGTFSTGTGAEVCTGCGVGATSNDNHDGCVDCLAGTYGEDEVNTKCKECNPGFYQPSTGQGSCIGCPEGTSAVNGTTCVDCLAGTYAQQQSDFCSPCERGTFSSVIKQSSCQQCPIGTFANRFGMSECKKCGAGERTRTPGRTSARDCVCAQGFYRPEQFVNSRLRCEPCPEGGVCPGNEKPPTAAEGYYVSDGATDVFVECKPKSSCLGKDTCAEGYVGFACGNCDVGYYRVTGQGCFKCPPNRGTWKIVLGFVAAFFVCLFVTLCVAPNVNSHIVTPAGIKVIPAMASPTLAISFFQTIAIFPQFNMKWPDSLTFWFDAFSIANFNIELVSPECATDMDFWGKWRLQMAIPLIVVGFFLIIFVMLVLAKLGKAAWDGRWDQVDVWEEVKGRALLAGAGLLFIILLLQLAMTQVVLTYFDCTKVPGSDRSTLDAEPAIFCDHGDYFDHLWLAIVGLVVYVFGIPLLLVCTLLYVQRYRGYTYLSHYPLTSNFVKKFDKRYFYFELIILARKNGVLIVAILLTSRVAEQAVLAFLVLLAALLVTALTQPFKFVYHDTLEFTLTLTSLMALFGGLILSISDLSENSRVGLTAFIHILIVVSIIVIIVCLVFEVQLRWHLVESAFVHFGNNDENPQCADCKNNGRFNVDAVVICKLCNSPMCTECRLSHGAGEDVIHPIVLLDAHNRNEVIDIPCDACAEMSDSLFEDPNEGMKLRALAVPLHTVISKDTSEDSYDEVSGRPHVTAVVKCIQCHMHLCDRCRRFHNMFKVNAKHDLITFDTFDEEQASRSAAGKDNKNNSDSYSEGYSSDDDDYSDTDPKEVGRVDDGGVDSGGSVVSTAFVTMSGAGGSSIAEGGLGDESGSQDGGNTQSVARVPGVIVGESGAVLHLGGSDSGSGSGGGDDDEYSGESGSTVAGGSVGSMKSAASLGGQSGPSASGSGDAGGVSSGAEDDEYYSDE